MMLKNGIVVNIKGTVYHLSVSVTKYAGRWIFTVYNTMDKTEEKELLHYTLYLHFDMNKNYLSFYPSGAVAVNIAVAIADEIKKHEHNWIYTH